MTSHGEFFCSHFNLTIIPLHEYLHHMISYLEAAGVAKSVTGTVSKLEYIVNLISIKSV